MTTATQVNDYRVEGNAKFAQVLQIRIGKRYVMEEFHGERDGKSAYERAVEWAQSH